MEPLVPNDNDDDVELNTFSVGVQMESNVQAHQGQVIQLCTSNALTTSRDQIGSRDRLVSLGTDNVIRVWIVRHPRERVIEIEAMSEVRLMTLPMEIAMIGNTLCMIMSNHKVVMCRYGLIQIQSLSSLSTI